MKILYISNGSNFKSAGGMEYHLLDITAWMKANGVDTALAVRKGTVLERELLRGRPDVYPLSWTGWGKVRSFFQLARAIHSYAPDIISINRERDIIRTVLISWCLRPFLKKRPRLVSVFHNSGWKGSWALRSLDGLIFPNEFMKGIYARCGRAVERSTVIYHGIHLPAVNGEEKLRQDRERKFFTGIPFPLIGMVGELRKNQIELIDVACELKKLVPEFTFAIVGRGKDEEVQALREKAERLGVMKHILITGGVDRSRIVDIFYDLDLSVTTNRQEPYGLVFLESMAAYAPVVAYDSGGPVEIVRKGGGMLAAGGPAEMAGTIARLITDHALRRRLALEARKAAEEHFSINAMGERHYRFYARLAGTR